MVDHPRRPRAVRVRRPVVDVARARRLAAAQHDDRHDRGPRRAARPAPPRAGDPRAAAPRRAWLDHATRHARAAPTLLAGIDQAATATRAVGTAVNDARYDGPACLDEPAEPAAHCSDNSPLLLPEALGSRILRSADGCLAAASDPPSGAGLRRRTAPTTSTGWPRSRPSTPAARSTRGPRVRAQRADRPAARLGVALRRRRRPGAGHGRADRQRPSRALVPVRGRRPARAGRRRAGPARPTSARSARGGC